MPDDRQLQDLRPTGVLEWHEKTIWKANRTWAASMAVRRGMPKPEDRSSAQQGIVRDERGQEQPADKARAQHVSRKDRGDDPPGDPKQR